MGQKIHPKNYRLGILYGWQSKWFAKAGAFRSSLRDDIKIREYLQNKLKDARVESVEVERGGKTDDIIVNIHTAKPGVVIGRGGKGIDDLKVDIEKNVLKNQGRVRVNIHEVRQGPLSAEVVAQNVAYELERRMPFRRAIKQALDHIQKAGAKGARIRVKGRLNGADIARAEKVSWGSIPLHTLRANIDYAMSEANTTYGVIGVSVWIYKGLVLDEEDKQENKKSEDVFSQIKKLAKEKPASLGAKQE